MQEQEHQLLQCVEALIFASEEPVTLQAICQITRRSLTQRDLQTLVETLNRDYEDTGRTFRIHFIAGGYRFLSEPEYGDIVRQLLAPVIQRRLSQSMLEVLSVVAWNQPVTKGEIQQIRGVSPDYSIDRLLARGLIEVRGRADTPGRPLQYGTTSGFLDLFHLSSLKDLPKLREIKEILREHEEQQYLAEGEAPTAENEDETARMETIE
ncbi:MAG: SMC-Scp complex subunit ScpB [Chlorobiaceae bacterium]|nr:SMC-Scp complex subunit ScpB [Chlorobiaceae bacterium]